MITKIRLCKGREIGKKSFAIGVSNSRWTVPHVRIEFSERSPYLDINDGEVHGIPIINAEDNEPVPATEIVKKIYEQNHLTISQHAKGYARRTHYGENFKWFIDYEKDLEQFFIDNKIPLPEDKRSFDEKMVEAAMGNLASAGVNISAGQRAIEEAKARLEETRARAIAEELKKTQDELELLRVEKESLLKEIKERDDKNIGKKIANAFKKENNEVLV